MKTTATITGPNGKKIALVFGIYGLKNFCRRLGCEPTIASLWPAFQGGTRLEAITELVRTGMEQASADKGDFTAVTEYEACEILQTAKDDEAEKVMKAFLSSIVGEDYDGWYKAAVEKAAAAEAQIQAELEESSDEKKAPLAPVGTKSKQKPTES